MNDSFKNLYLGCWLPHPYEHLENSELLKIQNDKSVCHEKRRIAKGIRLRRENLRVKITAY